MAKAKVEKAKVEKVERIPAIADIAPSDEYVTLQHLLIDSRVQGWTQSKTGRKMVKHFGNLVKVAKRSQNGECNVCDYPISDTRDVGQKQGYIVHRSCATWPSNISKAVKDSLKAFEN